MLLSHGCNILVGHLRLLCHCMEQESILSLGSLCCFLTWGLFSTCLQTLTLPSQQRSEEEEGEITQDCCSLKVLTTCKDTGA